jgi:hypothetical protein
MTYGEIFVLFLEGVLLNCSCCIRVTCDLVIIVQKGMLSYICIYIDLMFTEDDDDSRNAFR